MKRKLIILVTLMLPSLAFAGGNEYCGRCTPPSGETSANSTAKATATAVNETNVRVINANMLQSTSNINVNGGNPTATAYGGTGGSSNVTLQKGAFEGGDANAKVTLEKGAIKAEGGKSTVMQQQTAEGGDASNKGNTQEVNIAAPKRAPTFVAPTEAIVHQAPYVAKDGHPITSFVAEENVLMQSCPVGEIDGGNSSQSRSGWAEDRLVRVPRQQSILQAAARPHQLARQTHEGIDERLELDR